jgi:hypothetical protein
MARKKVQPPYDEFIDGDLSPDDYRSGTYLQLRQVARSLILVATGDFDRNSTMIRAQVEDMALDLIEAAEGLCHADEIERVDREKAEAA